MSSARTTSDCGIMEGIFWLAALCHSMNNVASQSREPLSASPRLQPFRAESHYIAPKSTFHPIKQRIS
jgi:hypothetical protein